MAGVAGGVRTPAASVEASQSVATTKLRDSCQACSMSKVKCPKEKPTCSRCENRSISCQYVFTRRPGRRRQAHRQPNEGKSTKTSSSFGTEHGPIHELQASVGACLLSPSTTPRGGNNDYLDMSPQGLSIPTSPRADYQFARENSDDISGLGEVNMFSSLANFDCNGNMNDMDFIMSAMDSPFGVPVLDNGSISQAHNDIESLLLPPREIDADLHASDVSSSICTISASSKVTTRAPDTQMLARSEVTRLTGTTNCGCLTQSLDLLKSLSAQAGPQPSISASDLRETPATLACGFSYSVVTENKQFLDVVGERLTCLCCSGDSFLLAVLSMTVLKILERYTAVARGQFTGTRTNNLELGNSFNLDRSIFDGNEGQIMKLSRTCETSRTRGRKAAQLVLSELHRVQRVVNQLSPKLKKSKGETYETGLDMELWGHQSMTQFWDRGPAAVFSATTLGQMESDVRISLGSLSSEIINGLRQS